ncbi:MAG: hypothetical protein ACLT2T_07940 [Bilophila wadsworthia]
MNLLSNALKFVDENGKVTLRVESLRRTGRQELCASSSQTTGSA